MYNNATNYKLPQNWSAIDDDNESMWDKEDDEYNVNYSSHYSTRPIYQNKHSSFTSSLSSLGTTPHSSFSSNAIIKDPGCIGLANLGFTCYLNSSIQILSHIKPLVDYFLSNKYLDEINTNNPLGSGGVLVTAFANIIKKLWKSDSNYSYIHPNEFKRKLDEITTQFEGFEQHDSQEFLLALLDGLHEDLNRIKDKPYVETTDFDGSISDQKASEIAWNWHLKRNNSVIVDWFQGQLKSKLMCSHCKKMVIKFDPMMYLSLPIPKKDNKKFFSVVYSYSLNQSNNFDNLYEDFDIDGNAKNRRNIRYSVEVDKYGTVADLMKEFSASIKVKEEHLILTEVYDNRFVKFFVPSDKLESINDTDALFAYHVEKKEGQQIGYSIHEKLDAYSYSSFNYKSYSSEEEDEKMYQYLPVVFRRGETSSQYSRKINFSIPSILIIPKSITYSQLYQHIFHFIRPFLFSESHFKSDNQIDTEDQDNTPSMNSKSKSSYITDSYDPYYGVDYPLNSSFGSPYMSSFSNHYSSRSENEEFNYEQDMNQLFELTLFDIYLQRERSSIKENYYSEEQQLNIPYNCCLAVDWSKAFYERYYNFSAEMESHEDDANYKVVTGSDDDEISIEKCLSFFTEEEGLKAENAWFCSNCNTLRPASIQIDLWKLPPILIIQLKRFGVDDVFQDREKIETKISFPLRDFDLSPFQRSSSAQIPSATSVYDLVAVSNHSGTMIRGHYITYAKNSNDGKWYRYDDSMVSEIGEDAVCTNNAYVLCYQRKDTFTPFDYLSYSLDDVSDDTNENDYMNGFGDDRMDEDEAAAPLMLYNLRDSGEKLMENYPTSNTYSTTYSNIDYDSWNENILVPKHDPLMQLQPVKYRNDDEEDEISRYQAPTQQNLGNYNSINDYLSRKRPHDSDDDESDFEY